jgi:hypothetical protein
MSFISAKISFRLRTEHHRWVTSKPVDAAAKAFVGAF